MLESLREKARQIIPYTRRGYDPYYKTVERRKDGLPARTKIISHAAGPITNSMQRIRSSVLEDKPPGGFDEDMISAWTPHMQMSVVDENTGQALTAAEASSRQLQEQEWMPQFFVNPMQDIDYMVVEAVLQTTIAGPMMGALTKFIVGTGFRPELEMINPDGTEITDKDRARVLEEEQSKEMEQQQAGLEQAMQPPGMMGAAEAKGKMPSEVLGAPPGKEDSEEDSEAEPDDPGQQDKPKKTDKEIRDELNAKYLKDHQYVIDALLEIDRQLDVTGGDEKDVSFATKMASLIDVTNAFNRSALIFSYEHPVTINGKKYREIPTGMKFAHPRDLGIVEITPGTWRLKSVQWRHAYNMIPVSDMIYLWNPLISAKYHNAWWYGGSMLLPMLDASRTMRRIISVDFQAMAEATWSGMFVLVVKPEGQTDAEKRAEYAAIANGFVRGGSNIMMEDPENVAFHQVDFQPKVGEFQGLTEFLIKYCAACVGLPQTMFFDESSANRATMIGKIQLVTSTVINPIREQYGQQISAQWYQRWFELLFKDDKELLEKVRVKLVWDDLHIESWFDKTSAVNEVDARKQLTDEAYGEMTGIDNYSNKVDPDAEVSPGGSGAGGQGGHGMDMGMDSAGNQLEMLSKKGGQGLKDG